ncbi:DUF4340 domain-containing protein [Candidatus Binatia bacterium]|jgi:hypothetical protein|nr:DUF4340 domain-containing protein [Candidatus Binatia bacterium]
MTWLQALGCWVVAGLLLVVLRITAPAPPPPIVDGSAEAPAPAASAVPSALAERAPVAEPQRAYELDPAKLTRIEVRRGDRTVILEQADGRWKVVQPTDRVIPFGLVSAFVEQLVDSGHGERISDDARDPAFGFAAPTVRIDAQSADGGKLTLVLGARTPAGTAVYALEEHDGRVVSVGLNLQYYVDLLMG